MKAIKLTTDDYKRSLKVRNMNYLWLYRKFDTTQRTHNNSIFLTRTIGEPFACLVVEYDRTLCDDDIEKIFGKDNAIVCASRSSAHALPFWLFPLS